MTAVLVTGATGFIGAPLVARMLARGDRVIALVRDEPAARRRWSQGVQIVRSLDDLPADLNLDAVVNLAGAPVAAGRWTRRRRAVLLDSRVETTRAIGRLIARLEQPPSVVVNASAIGIYGDRGDQPLPDDSEAGVGFMADLVRLWEQEMIALETTGARVCRLRLGMVFAWRGGPLALLGLAARLGVATVLGGGRQWAPWIDLEDTLRLIDVALVDPRYDGAINAVAPGLVTQRQLTDTLARHVGRPRWLGLPGWMLRLALGEMSDLFLASERVEPRRLQALGFIWSRPRLPDALAAPRPATAPPPPAASRAA